MSSLRVLAPLLLLALFTGFLGPAKRIQHPKLIGTWIGQTEVHENHWRSWKAVHRANGDLEVHHREYTHERLIEEYTQYGTWWTQAGYLYEDIDLLEDNDGRTDRNHLYVYRLLKIEDNQMVYQYIRSGVIYTANAASESSDF